MSKDEQICNIQGVLLDIPAGMTRVVHGQAVTRWSKDSFEVGTWGSDDLVGSETAAETLAG